MNETFETEHEEHLVLVHVLGKKWTNDARRYDSLPLAAAVVISWSVAVRRWVRNAHMLAAFYKHTQKHRTKAFRRLRRPLLRIRQVAETRRYTKRFDLVEFFNGLLGHSTHSISFISTSSGQHDCLSRNFLFWYFPLPSFSAAMALAQLENICPLWLYAIWMPTYMIRWGKMNTEWDANKETVNTKKNRVYSNDVMFTCVPVLSIVQMTAALSPVQAETFVGCSTIRVSRFGWDKWRNLPQPVHAKPSCGPFRLQRTAHTVSAAQRFRRKDFFCNWQIFKQLPSLPQSILILSFMCICAVSSFNRFEMEWI